VGGNKFAPEQGSDLGPTMHPFPNPANGFNLFKHSFFSHSRCRFEKKEEERIQYPVFQTALVSGLDIYIEEIAMAQERVYLHTYV
jgi:hypothetical protein